LFLKTTSFLISNQQKVLIFHRYNDGSKQGKKSLRHWRYYSLSVIFVLLFSLLPCIDLTAQQEQIIIKGRVMDEETPLPFAQVAIYPKGDDNIIEGGSSAEDGFFVLRIPPPKGKIELKVYFLGYKTQTVDIRLGGNEIDLGRIFLQVDASQLEGVDVKSERAFMTTSIDKRVFDVSQNLVSEGGTAEDALQNIPSVSVDMDGGISLRGSSNVTIWINGKPSALIGGDRNAFLDQLPASEIDRIEVITNPSSKYDADGTAGIINIILKKDRQNGTNGSFTAAVGTRNKSNQNLLLNHRQGKLTLGMSYSFNYQEIFRERESQRTNFLQDSVFSNNQSFFADNISRNHVGRFTADYELTKNQQLSFNVGGGTTNRHRFERDDFEFLDGDERLFNSFRRNNDRYRLANTFEIGLDHKVEFEQQGREWTSSISYSSNTSDDDQFTRQIQPAIYRPGSDADSLFRENFLEGGRNTFFTVQTDYVQPLSKKSKYEIGAKTVIRTIETDLERQIEEEGLFERDPRVSNEFSFVEAVHAAYVNYQNRWGKFGFQGGLRGEVALTESRQLTLDSVYPYNYANLFPSMFFSYNLSENEKFQASYTRRINRPSPRNLNPITDITDPLNFRQGNPFLEPELFDSYEVGYEKIQGKHTMTAAVYYRATNNQITRFRRLLDPSDPRTNGEEGITLTSFENLIASRSVGVEGIYILSLGRKLNAQGSFNYFYRTLLGDNIQPDLNNAGQSWTARGNANWSPNDKWNFQFSFFYWGPGPTPQGRRLAIYAADAAARYTFANKKASVSLRVSDIFNTRRFRLEIDDPTFVNTFMFNRETQIAFLSFTYKFGRDAKDRRDQERGGRGENGDDFFEM
jgi:iron complex outermembrane receptor protein